MFVLYSASDFINHICYEDILNENDQSGIYVYKKIDECIGRLINALPEKTNIIIMSDHGFKEYKGEFMVNTWLKEEGYLLTEKGIDPGAKHSEIVKQKKTELRLKIPKYIYRNRILLKIARRFASIANMFLKVRGEINERPSQKSKALSTTTESLGIYINDTERFTDGTVKRADVSSLRKEIIRKMEVLNEKYNGLIFEKVWEKKNIVPFKKALTRINFFLGLSEAEYRFLVKNWGLLPQLSLIHISEPTRPY